MTIEKKYLNKADSAAMLNCSIQELNKISVAGFLKKYKIGRLIGSVAKKSYRQIFSHFDSIMLPKSRIYWLHFGQIYPPFLSDFF